MFAYQALADGDHEREPLVPEAEVLGVDRIRLLDPTRPKDTGADELMGRCGGSMSDSTIWNRAATRQRSCKPPASVPSLRRRSSEHLRTHGRRSSARSVRTTSRPSSAAPLKAFVDRRRMSARQRGLMVTTPRRAPAEALGRALAKTRQDRRVSEPHRQGRAPKRAAESATEMVQVVLPNDANPLGFILGGTVMHLIDIAGAIACHRHTRRLLVTAAVDGLQFLHPIKVGDLIILKARVTAAGARRSKWKSKCSRRRP